MNRPLRPRLRLSGMMEAVAAVAIVLAFWSWRLKSRESTAFFDSLLIVVTGSSLFVIAIVLRGAMSGHRLLDRWTTSVGFLNALFALWFISVEWCWFYEDCPGCLNSRAVLESRVLSVVIHRSVGEWHNPTTIESVAADLGTPCAHGGGARWLRQRWSGHCLLIENRGRRPFQSRWYPACARDLVRSWQKIDPDLAREFRARVLAADPDRKDWSYWRGLLARLRAACAPPPPPADPLTTAESPVRSG